MSNLPKGVPELRFSNKENELTNGSLSSRDQLKVLGTYTNEHNDLKVNSSSSTLKQGLRLRLEANKAQNLDTPPDNTVVSTDNSSNVSTKIECEGKSSFSASTILRENMDFRNKLTDSNEKDFADENDKLQNAKKSSFFIPPLPSGAADIGPFERKRLDKFADARGSTLTPLPSRAKFTRSAGKALPMKEREVQSNISYLENPNSASKFDLSARNTESSSSEENNSQLGPNEIAIHVEAQAASACSRKSETKKVMFAESVKDGDSKPSSIARFSTIRRSQLSRKRNLGSAKRIDPTKLNDDSDTENNSRGNDSSSESNALDDGTHRTPRKVVKMDLGYMLNWDPEEYLKRKKNSISTPDPENESQRSKLSNSPTPNEAEWNQSSKECRNSPHNHDLAKENNEENNNPAKKRLKSETESPKVAQTPERSSIEITYPKLNKDFIPLASENNMLTVNGKTYAKLGVIGKGGSCKVYRALSKDCQVLAIKKVKLAGKDQKQIDLFANEINLLKRLTGNPAIIQMYDSEVDLKRKAIFVVMEAGEVDLNYVLQQQTKMAQQVSDSKRTMLDINFVRLTWQQMLKAVHFIHEERIVHGDLKPANFLFVKGALKLIDFGIAKAIQHNDTTNIYRDSQIGTLNYMSPEAIMGTCDSEGNMKMKLGRVSQLPYFSSQVFLIGH